MTEHPLQTVRQASATPYSATRFEVSRCSSGWTNNPDARNGWLTSFRGEISAATLDEAIVMALCEFSFNHKDVILIRETGTRFVEWASSIEERPYDCLHIYQVKRKSTPRYEYRDYAYHRQHDLYAAHVCTVDCGIFNSTHGGPVAQQAPSQINRSAGDNTGTGGQQCPPAAA